MSTDGAPQPPRASDERPRAARAGERSWLVLATAGGLGYAPVAPGTFGSVGGVALYLLLAPLGTPAVALAAGLLLWLGARSADVAERHFGQHDDGRIVVDEVVGQLVALLPLGVLAAGRAPAPGLLVAGFLAFRLFDVWKPGPVRAAEQRFAGGLGVMLDDVVAGALAALLLTGALLVAGEGAA